MNKREEAIIETEVIDRLSIYREKIMERKELLLSTLEATPKAEDFKGDTVLSNFLTYYTTNETRRLSDTITSTMPLKQDTIELLQEKQLAIRHLKLFIQNIGTQVEEMKDEISNIDEALTSIDNGTFDESIIENLDLGV